MTPNEEPTTDLAGKVRALPEQGVPNIGGHSLVQRDAVLALIEAEARATATPTPEGPVRLALEAMRDAYGNGRLHRMAETALAALERESEARATATPGLDVERLEKAFVRVIDRRPTKVEVAYFYGDSIPVEHQREAFLRNVAAEYAALYASGETEPS